MENPTYKRLQTAKSKNGSSKHLYPHLLTLRENSGGGGGGGGQLQEYTRG